MSLLTSVNIFKHVLSEKQQFLWNKLENIKRVNLFSYARFKSKNI